MEPMSSSPESPPRLLEGERIVANRPVAQDSPRTRPSELHELYRLARADGRGDIGDFGPVLASRTLEGHSPDRDLHRYEAIFGRDSLRVALNLLNLYPKLARSTLIKLAESQGVEINNAREEEPGRIIHEIRDPIQDPVARELTRELGWDWPYYGSVDATVEFIRTLAAYCRSSGGSLRFMSQEYIGRDSQTHTMADSFKAAVSWLNDQLDANAEGLLEFKRMNPRGIENQAWKDSWDSYFHADGQIADHRQGIASVEVQSIALDALLDAAEFYDRHFNQPEKAGELRQRAGNLKKLILDRFWTDKKNGFFVLGTDRSGQTLRQLQIRTSNMGQLLNSPTLLSGNDGEPVIKREAIIGHLFSAEMLSVSGVRTLATDEYRFRPGAYHNGSVWMWDNYLIAQGLERHGYYGLAYELEKRIQKVIETTHEFPEFVRGDDNPIPSSNTAVIEVWDEKNQRVNRLEQPSQEVQAWTVAAILAMHQRRQASYQAALLPSERALEDKILQST